jgi:SAM-dependent methyltransferase
MPEPDPREIVRRGYDVLSYHYRGDDAGEGGYAPWLARLRRQVPAGGSVLDLGCGAGVPVARALAADGFTVTGVDLSEVQIRRARQLAPLARFLPGPVPRRAGWAARRRCGGATPTPPPTATGSAGPASR